MNVSVNGININYEIEGSGRDVLLLHGWGTSVDLMRPVFNELKNHCRVCMLDFPGFGKSDSPPEYYDVYSYADLTKAFIEKIGLNDLVIMGHSFGGRIAIILAAKNMVSVKKLVLTDSAGVRPKRGIGYYTKVYSYKTAKAIAKAFGGFSKKAEEGIRKSFGSDDYRALSPSMRQVFVRVVNEDLTYLFKEVNVPALLVWGDKDDATPISDAKIMEKLMPDAGLVILKGSGHYSYLEQLDYFNRVFLNFLQ